MLRDWAAWTAWRTRVRAQGGSPEVDWPRDAIVAVVAPEFTNGPATLEFTETVARADTVYIHYRLRFTEQANDYGSQELGAITLPRTALDGRVIRVERSPSQGGEPSLAPPPNAR